MPFSIPLIGPWVSWVNYMMIQLLILAVSFGFVAAYGVDMAALYQDGASFVAAEHITICGQFFVGAVLFLFVGLLMQRAGAYSLMKFLANIFMEVSLLILTALSLLALFFGVALQQNLWADLLSVVMVPFIGLGTAMLTLYLFGFNYPFAHRVLPVICLFAISLGLLGFGII